MSTGDAKAQPQAAPIRTAGAVAPAASPLTYADLVDLALPADFVAKVQVRKASRLKPADSPGIAPGRVRFYIEATTQALLIGPATGESVRFLADVPLDAKGKPPKLNKLPVLVLARTVPGKPADLALVAPDAMLPWSAELEQKLRAILTEMVQPDAPPHITALREALHVPGNLAGEGETQLFFATEGGKPVSLSIIRRPGMDTTWGVSFSEIVDQAARPPAPESLAWYRLACSLPATLPDRANISPSAQLRRVAAEDYAQVVRELGPCARTRTQP
ncbi:hypothetical protein [Novosphingobium cyanobacteriorum]|uniref:Uncharacterized protein n=1 Tax=Novosphingobium cyanobacteriorum TaxID=3024215 RepID=A0ABT6CG36_9SPHN|nr:hypothetical protein [Novosphingobium cyanobacteriorum]MDF8332887.1 hypothetical protein [Novosphingobium cyanobacteriorum]